MEEAATHAKEVVEQEVEAAIAKASCHDDVYSKVNQTRILRNVLTRKKTRARIARMWALIIAVSGQSYPYEGTSQLKPRLR